MKHKLTDKNAVDTFNSPKTKMFISRSVGPDSSSYYLGISQNGVNVSFFISLDDYIKLLGNKKEKKHTRVDSYTAIILDKL